MCKVELKNLFRTFYNPSDGKIGLPVHPRPQVEKFLSANESVYLDQLPADGTLGFG